MIRLQCSHLGAAEDREFPCLFQQTVFTLKGSSFETWLALLSSLRSESQNVCRTRLEKGDVPVAIFGETLDDDLLSAHLGCWSGLRLLFERVGRQVGIGRRCTLCVLSKCPPEVNGPYTLPSPITPCESYIWVHRSVDRPSLANQRGWREVSGGIKLQKGEGEGGRARENASDASPFPRSNQPRDPAGGSRSKFHTTRCGSVVFHVTRSSAAINDATRRPSSLYHTCPPNTRSSLLRPDSQPP